MKKLLLITQYFPPSMGGIQNFNWQLVRHMPPEDVVVLTDNYGEETKQISSKADYKIYYRKLFWFQRFVWPKWMPMIWQMFMVVVKERPKVVWAGETLPAGVIVWLYAKIFKYSYFLSEHRLIMEDLNFKKGILVEIKKWIVKKIVGNASFITVNSLYTGSLFEVINVDKNKILPVYPCPNVLKGNYNEHEILELIESDPTLKELRDFKSGKGKIILTVSRLSEIKNFGKMLEAWALVKKQYSQAKYVITGSGPLEEDIKKKINELQLQDSVVLTGSFFDKHLAAIYSLADIFAMVSKKESFGVVYLEAASFSMPVIGPKTGGAREAICELKKDNLDKANGLLVDDPGNHEEIANKILSLLTNEQLSQTLGQNGQRWSEQFTWDKNAILLINQFNN